MQNSKLSKLSTVTIHNIKIKKDELKQIEQIIK